MKQNADSYLVTKLPDQFPAGTHITVEVPGSKSITNRALLLATLADGPSTIHGCLFSDDSRHFLDCIKKLGYQIRVSEAQKTVRVVGHGNAIPLSEAAINVGSAGTAARFLTAMLGLSEGTYTLDASPQMKKRPMKPLMESLEELGCQVTYLEKEGFFPFRLEYHPNSVRTVDVDIEQSSQFLSGLLIAFGNSDKDRSILVHGNHGMAYIDMTLKMMSQFGVHVIKNNESIFTVIGGQHYEPKQYQVEPDVSAACYFYGMAAVLGISVTVKDVAFSSMQGDLEFLRVLEQMGCEIIGTPDGVCVKGPKKRNLKGVEVDMSAFSDQAITLAVIAAYAKTPTVITGIGHIRYQECDRIHAIVSQLEKCGIVCDTLEDGIRIHPGKVKPGKIDTFEDHRVAMGFSLLGLVSEGIEIQNPNCCKKTFENYFDVFTQSTEELQNLCKSNKD